VVTIFMDRSIWEKNPTGEKWSPPGRAGLSNHSGC
jgi:hypothetical protein